MPRIRGRVPRRVLVADIGDLGVRVVATHLYGIHALKRHPTAWWRELRALRAAAEGADIVGGDMNMWSPVIDRAVAMRPAARGRTWPAWRPHSQIDHLLVGPRVEILDGHVGPDLGSDHRPVVATVRVRVS